MHLLADSAAGRRSKTLFGARNIDSCWKPHKTKRAVFNVTYLLHYKLLGMNAAMLEPSVEYKHVTILCLVQ